VPRSYNYNPMTLSTTCANKTSQRAVTGAGMSLSLINRSLQSPWLCSARIIITSADANKPARRNRAVDGALDHHCQEKDNQELVHQDETSICQVQPQPVNKYCDELAVDRRYCQMTDERRR